MDEELDDLTTALVTTAIGGGGGSGRNSYSIYQYTSGPNYMSGTLPNAVITTGTGTTFAPVVTPFTNTNGLIYPSHPNLRQLTRTQLDQLLREHRFIPMDNSSYCLYCFALDHYRDAAQHLFVISEE
jgi:hypothetical protein